LDLNGPSWTVLEGLQVMDIMAAEERDPGAVDLIGPGYCIRLDAACCRVEAWTVWRLPFNDCQTPVQKSYCSALGATIRKLRTDGRLDASYFEPEGSRTKADLENLLFYNVGTSPFHGVAAEMQRFTKRIDAPDCPAPLGFGRLHYARYEAAGPDSWTSGGALIASAHATWRTKPTTDMLWRSFKSTLVAQGERLVGPLALTMTVTAPPSAGALPDMVKRLADAFLSALHCYKGNQLEEIVRRLSLRLPCAADEARRLLLAGPAPLGPRRVPHLWKDGLMWSPADDRLVAGTFVRAPCRDGPIRVNAELTAP
jgi:hypothetical protein